MSLPKCRVLFTTCCNSSECCCWAARSSASSPGGGCWNASHGRGCSRLCLAVSAWSICLSERRSASIRSGPCCRRALRKNTASWRAWHNARLYHAGGHATILYYYPFVSSRAPPFFWGRLVTCGRLVIGLLHHLQMSEPFAACRYVGQ